MKKKIMYIAVSAMLIAGTSCSSVFAFDSKKTAVTAQASASSSSTYSNKDHQKADGNMLMGKVTSVSDGTLTLETMGKNHMGQPNMVKHKSSDGSDDVSDTQNTDNSSDTASSDETSTTSEEKTVALTDNTVYYKMSAATSTTDGTKSEETKADAALSDVTTDSMVFVKYEKDADGNLTADSVTIMDSSMMNNAAKPDENMLRGKVTAIADGTLTLETTERGYEKKADKTSSSSDDSAEEPATEEKTVALTDSTVYYKMSAATTTDETKPEETKADAALSDVTADSMVFVKYEKDADGNLTADSVTIMDSSMMNNADKPDENMLRGKVSAIADGTLTLETMERGYERKADKTSSSSDDSAEEPATEEKTVALTDSTVYYKMTAETDNKPKFTKTDATESDVTADSMVSVKYEKDDNGNLTADSVTIMDSSMMKNKNSSDSTSSSEE